MVASMRSRRSTADPRVTLYEPAAAAASSSQVNSPALPAAETPMTPHDRDTTPSPKRVRLTRSATKSTRGLLKEESDGDESVDKKPRRKTSTSPKKEATPRKPTPFVNSLPKPHPAPTRWQQQFDIIENQRRRIVAAVDTMGCEQGGGNERSQWKTEQTVKNQRLSVLVSLMLSSQTKDPVTHQATMNLHTMLEKGLSLDGLEESSVEEIDRAICKVGFHNTKAANLKKLAVRLREEHGGDVPDDLTKLLALNGVGPKMAMLYLQSVGVNIGIGVDVHVHRITNRLGWHKPVTQTPEQTRLNLESWLPKDKWRQINKMLVGFGQEVCKPVGPRCDLCDLGNQPNLRLCPSYRKVVVKTPSPKKRVKLENGVKIEIDEEKPEIAADAARIQVKIENEGAVIEDKPNVKRAVTPGGEELEMVAVKDEEGILHQPLVW